MIEDLFDDINEDIDYDKQQEDAYEVEQIINRIMFVKCRSGDCEKYE